MNIDIPKFTKGIAQIIKDYVKPTADRLDALEQRIAELEQRPAVAYRGVWDAAVVYQRGVFVTFGGSLWHCNETCSNARPGDGSAIWTLAVKRGRDGAR